MLAFSNQLARQDIDLRDPLDLVAEQLDANGLFPFEAGKISITSPRTRKVPRTKLISFR